MYGPAELCESRSSYKGTQRALSAAPLPRSTMPMMLSSAVRNRFRASEQAAPELSLAEILSALSFALDLTEGAIPGHAVRTTLLGMRIARALNVSLPEQSALYYSLQLKDVGCSSNAARMSQIFGGDDRAAKAMTKQSDWTGLFHAFSSGGDLSSRLGNLSSHLGAVPGDTRALWTTVCPGASVTEKLRHIVELGKNTEVNTKELIDLRCDRGAEIMRKLNLNEVACDAVRHMDEHWDGSGYPDRLQGDEIPLLARIIAVAQNLDVFARKAGTHEAIQVLRRRSGSWFDPELVKAAILLHERDGLWQQCDPYTSPEESMQAVVVESPELPKRLRADQIDTICEVFADVVDAKSPFTFRHSMGVADVVKGLADQMQLPAATKQHLARAALLHDLGKLGVSNTILDKPGKLTADELKVIWGHPENGRTILARISGFENIADLAWQHHEKLDGSGYPSRLRADQLSVETRLLTIADCFTALTESRPYREDMSVEAAMAILRRDVPTKIDAEVFEVLESLVPRWSTQLPAALRPNPN